MKTSTRNVALLFASSAALVAAATGGNVARADVMWEHIGTLQTSLNPQKPLVQVKTYNTWTAQRHRLLLNYAFAPSVAKRAGQMESRMPSMPMLAPNTTQSPTTQSLMPRDGAEFPGIKTFGSLGFVDDLQNDRVLAYESQSRLMISEPRRALMKRLRFNPWKKLAPELANEAPPTLTEEQRLRLVRETGALLAPIRKRVSQTFFRPLPGTKTFSGLTAKGYRLTQLVNVGGMKNQSWMRVSFEWWLAPQDEGDNDIAQFNAQKQRERKKMGGLTNSMWLNEYFALAAIPNDPILRAAWSSFRVPADAPEGAFRGTPLLVTVKTTLPPLQRVQVGDILFTLRLSQINRSANLPTTVFEAPKGYTKYDIQPALKKLDPVLDGSAWISLWDYAFNLAR